MMILDAQSESIRHYSKRLMCPVTGFLIANLPA